jgi:MerR family redox-sensitive transcriptional activator SoxR
MTSLTISQAAAMFGLRPSAIRYYEEIGLLQHPPRVGGQRRYDEVALDRLAVIQRSRQLGFALADIRALFFSYRNGVPPSKRWRELSERKLQELDRRVEEIRALEAFLREQGNCGCTSLEACGRNLRARAACAEPRHRRATD